MSGLVFDVGATIAHLRQLLAERYPRAGSELPLLKEIVQNADDAGASELHLVVLETGLTGVANPLLSGPALVCVNNGGFKTEDEDALRSFGNTSKAGDDAAIGRFGVGQKSVFHLAEAYFYLGRPSPTDPIRGDVIDPWANTSKGDQYFPTWNEFTLSDRDLVHRALARWLEGPSWFALYLPLRTREHERGAGGLIDTHIPEVEQLTSDLADLTQLGCLAPQLYRVRKVATWSLHSVGDRPVSLGLARWRPEGDGLSRPKSPAPFRREYRGVVEIERLGAGTTTIDVFGSERCVPDRDLLAVREHPRWPTRASVSPDGTLENKREKAIPHGAATFLRVRDGGAHLQLSWAAFLPLGTSPEVIPRAELTPGWRLFLHGYFFPDSGRQGVAGGVASRLGAEAPKTTEEVRAYWNTLLWQRATLPALVPALEVAVRASPTEEGEQLATALSHSLVWKMGREGATAGGVLAFGPGSTDAGAIESRARLVDAVCCLLPIPRVSKPEGALADLLRCFFKVERSGAAALVWTDGPRLGARGDFDAWEPGQGKTVIEEIPPRLLETAATLEYLDAWARASCETGTGLGEHFPALLRRCFAASVLTLGVNVERWRALASHCPDDAILWSAAPITLLRELSQLPTTILLLPEKLRPDAPDRARPTLSIADARTLLATLADKLEGERSGEDVERLIAELVTHLGARAVLEDSVLCELRIVRVWSARVEAYVCLKPDRLRSLLQQGAAFRAEGVARAKDFARKVAGAIVSLDDVVLVDDTAMADAMEVRPFDEQALKMLLLAPSAALGGPSERYALLSWLLGAAPGTFGFADLYNAARRDPDVALALRHLVHGNRDHLDDHALLLVAPDAGDEVGAAILRATGNAWRLVPGLLAQDLNMRWMATLEIAQLDSNALMAELESLTAEQSESLGGALTPGHRAALRTLLARKRASVLFRALAIHDTLGNRIVSGGAPGIYLRNAWPLPVAMQGSVDLVAPSEDPAERALQAEVFPTWSAEAQLMRALESDEPSRLAQEVLGALAAFEVTSPEQLDSLRVRKWLFTRDGQPAAPGEVLHLAAEVDRSVRLLLGDGARVFLSPGDIAADLRHHDAFQWVLDRAALSGRDAIRAVALQLEDRSREGENPYWILGSRSRADDRAFLEQGVEVGALASDPVWSLVRALIAKYPDDFHEVCRDLLECFRLRPAAGRVADLLVRFKDERGVAAEGVDRSRSMFDDYLRYAVTRSDFVDEILPRIELLNANRTWKPTAELAWFDAINLQPRFQVAERHREILGAAIGPRLDTPGGAAAGAPEQSTAEDEANGAELLSEYFGPWTGVISPEPIGYFLACLGNGADGAIARLAERFLQKSKSADGARDLVFLELGAEAVAFELSFCARARWTFQAVADGDDIEVLSLAGHPFVAKVGGSTRSSVFVGRIPRGIEGAPRLIRLASLDPASIPAPELQDLLGASLRAFLVSSVGFPLDKGKLEAFWSQFGSGGKTQVAAVRSLILDRLPVYIEELVGRRDPVFRAVCQTLERAEQRYREVSEIRGMPPDTVAKAEAAREAARARLRKLVEEDPTAQGRLLSAVREKLKTYQYRPEQVLFELFQNADDATRDLQDLHDAGTSSSRPDQRGFAVTVEGSPAKVRIQHWGRAINRGEMSARDPQATERNYDLDLKNMLVLHLSDKDVSSTGRFGLGFKSVHLVTDRPRVRSADLSFDVVGGLVPQHAPIGGAPDASTIIEFPLVRPEHLPSLVTGFRACAGLLTAFSRAIRRITFTEAGVRREVAWSPTRIDGVDGLEVGELTDLDPARDAESARALVLRGSDPAAALTLAFRLGARGLEPFDGIPDLWYTAPTRESWGLGFCVNAAFELDVGRGQLAYTAPENRHRFAALGELLAHSLAGLAAAMEQRFEPTVRALGIEVGAGAPELVRRNFWKSVFDQLTAESWAHRGPERLALIQAMHGPGAGLSSLIAAHRVLPTRLPGEHDVLTTSAGVRCVLDETASRPEVFQALLDLGTWSGRPTPGTAVGAEVRTRLQRAGSPALQRASALSFADILEKALPDRTIVSLELARGCAKLVAAVEDAFGPISSQLDLLRGRLASAFFPTRGEKARCANELLVGRRGELERHLDPKRVHNLQDELARAEFAPDDHVLHADFGADPAALNLFAFARQHLVAGSTAQVARWAMLATAGLRPAVLGYLVSGALARSVLDEIRQQGGLPWCQGEGELAMYAGALAPLDFNGLRVYLLGQSSPLSAPLPFDEGDAEDGPAGPLPPIPDDPEALLQRIAAWWRRRGDHWTGRFEKEVYGTLGGAATIAAQLRSDERDAWLTLLALAACQRFGRQSDAQHAGFVHVLREKGTPRWWNVVASPPAPGKAADWIGILDRWLAERTDEDQYRLWLGLYPTLYQLHRYGDTYRELLARAHDHRASTFSLQLLLAPRANPMLTGAGAGLDAPPLAPALGIGASWALRELVRLNVIPPADHVARYCYVPRLRTRDLLRRLGAPDMDGSFVGDHGERSKRMFEFVAGHLGEEGACFGGAFDHPLYLYATRTDVQEECAE